MHRSALLLLLMCIAGCASVAPVGSPVSAPSVQAEVRRDGDVWTVDYDLHRDSPVWIFPLSAPRRRTQQPWRPGEWSVETPGVVLRREGAHDVLTTTDGGTVPRRLRLTIRSVAGSLEREYDPAIVFTDGTVALYSEQFDLVPAFNLEAVRNLEPGSSTSEIRGTPATVTYSDTAGPVMFRGERLAQITAAAATTYVVFGSGEVTEGKDAAILADPALPTWLRTELLDFAPQVMAGYAERLGPRIEIARPMMLVSWGGPTAGKVDMSGGVRPGLILLAFEGEGVLDRERRTLSRARWFIAHEAAHFWLGSSGVAYEKPEDAWITEGGADLMAIRLLGTIDPDFDVESELKRSIDDCVKFGKNPIGSASSRNESRAYYACGLVFALLGESATKKLGGRDWFDFLQLLLAANLDDRTLSSDEWLAELTRVSGDTSLRADVSQMLTEGVDDPAAHIDAMFLKAGVIAPRLPLT